MRLEIEGLSKSYGKTVALRNMTLTLTDGIYALLGPNGSGKSTFMNILTDNLKADAGRILFEGEDIAKMGARFREKLGFMPQYSGMYARFTVEDFLWYMAKLKGISNEKAKTEVPRVLAAVELSDSLHAKVGALSGGMKQRLALAQATLGTPRLLILDEPTAGLDPKQRISVRNYISQLARDKIVILATHVVSDMESIAKEAILLKKGIVIAHDAPAALAGRLKGRVFELRCRERDIAAYEKSHQIIRIAGGEDDDVVLRILGDGEAGMKAVTPTLEDYYLSVFGKSEGTF